MFHVPAHKQTNPAALPGQVREPRNEREAQAVLAVNASIVAGLRDALAPTTVHIVATFDNDGQPRLTRYGRAQLSVTLLHSINLLQSIADSPDHVDCDDAKKNIAELQALRALLTTR